MKKVIILAVLVLLLFATSCQALGIGENLKSVVVPTNGTAYIVADFSSVDDPEGLRDQNFSTQDFIKVWYANQIQSTEQLVSFGLMKFDLSALKGKDIRSATLQMYSTRTDFSSTEVIGRLVDVNLVNAPWDAESVTFNTRPGWESNAVARTLVYGPGFWYSWDVSGSVAARAEDGEVSFVTGLLTIEEEAEEQVVFASQNVSEIAPRLLVTYASSGTVSWWVWVIIIVVVAIIAFFIGWAVKRRGSEKSS